MVGSHRPDDKLTATVALRYSDRVYATLDNTDVYTHTYQGFDSFLVADVRLNYDFDKHWNASIGVDNINNRRYFLFHPFPQATTLAQVAGRSERDGGRPRWGSRPLPERVDVGPACFPARVREIASATPSMTPSTCVAGVARWLRNIHVRASPARQAIEILDGGHEACVQFNARLPTKFFLRQGDLRLPVAADRPGAAVSSTIVDREPVSVMIFSASSSIRKPLGEVAEVYGPCEIVPAVHQRNENP